MIYNIESTAQFWTPKLLFVLQGLKCERSMKLAQLHLTYRCKLSQALRVAYWKCQPLCLRCYSPTQAALTHISNPHTASFTQLPLCKFALSIFEVSKELPNEIS